MSRFPRFLSAALLCAALLPAHADIPQNSDTQCFFVSAKGKPGKLRPCRAEAASSAPRPNLPDTRFVSYQIGRRSYTFTADYDSASQSWQPSYRGGRLDIYYRNPSRRRLMRENETARYVCYRTHDVHLCAVRQPAPYW